eukprot:301859_1
MIYHHIPDSLMSSISIEDCENFNINKPQWLQRQMMKALVCSKIGTSLQDALSNIQERIVPIPQLSSKTELLVKIHAAGLNFADTLIYQGKYQTKYDIPFIIGSEFSGTVIKIGENVKRFKTGDRVAGFIRVSCFAEYTIVEEYDEIWKVPDDMNFNDAAVFCCTYGTAYMSLIQRAKLNSSHTVCITAASGGVGSAALQIAKAYQCKKIICCVGSESKAKLAKQNGADVIINYKVNNKWGYEIKKQGGIDIVIDTVGGNATDQCLKAMNWYGKVVIIGFASGSIPKIKANRVLLKNIDLLGVAWGRNATYGDYQVWLDSIKGASKLYSRGLVKPLIGKVYEFNAESVKQAYMDLASRKSVGKLVVAIDKSSFAKMSKL